MTSVIPFEIAISDDQLDKLQKKLALAEFPDELEDAGWDFGVPLADMKRLTTYWRNKFDWRKQEEEMNQLPNFRTEIQVDVFEPLKIHFVHQQSNVTAAIPLLFLHGWPGNFLEVQKLLPLLAKNDDDDGRSAPAFHVVAPSLPNYGFSEGVKTRGFALKQYAETCHKLMLKLGYEQYVTQGGDLGAHISRMMGAMYPQHCRGTHVNYIRPSAPTLTSSPLLFLQHANTAYTPAEKRGLALTAKFRAQGTGYSQVQSTKPQTLSYGLASSPIALLAWVYEKLHDWSDSYAWTDDEILTWVSIYWFSTAGAGASVRIYYEIMHSELGRNPVVNYIPHVKLGIAYFPQELNQPPRIWGRTLGPVVYESENGSGGHFAAHERPEAIARDLGVMFGKGGGAYGVVEGRDGYNG